MDDERFRQVFETGQFSIAFPAIDVPGTRDKLALVLSALRDGYQTPDGVVTLKPSPASSIGLTMHGDKLAVRFTPLPSVTLSKFGLRYTGALRGLDITVDAITVLLDGLPDPVLQVVS